MSPASGTGMSPSYPHSEPSPDQMGGYNNTVIIGNRMTQRPPSSSPPLTPNPQSSMPTNNGEFLKVFLKYKFRKLNQL